MSKENYDIMCAECGRKPAVFFGKGGDRWCQDCAPGDNDGWDLKMRLHSREEKRENKPHIRKPSWED